MRSLKNELEDRLLRFDGVSEVEASELARFLLLGVPASKLRVKEETEDVKTFNEQVRDEDQIHVGLEEPIELNMEWQLPDKYKNLNVDAHVLEILHCKLDYDEEMYFKAKDRVNAELNEIYNRGMLDFFRTIIFILDELKKHNVVWGVGRGSSCASYLLFLLGLHVVDCVTMEVPMEEFFHE